MNFNIYDLFRGNSSMQNIVGVIILAIFVLGYFFSPAKVLNCVNGSCSITKGKTIIAKFNSSDIRECRVSKRYESCRKTRSLSSLNRDYVRGKCASGYKYLPEIRLNNGTVIGNNDLYIFFSESSANNFCSSVKNNKNYKFKNK